jgi:hypothetical protein
MKKLFVLFLCLMAVAGFVSAGTVHPPGAQALGMALSENGVYEAAVTPDAVLIVVTLTYGFSDQILAVFDLTVSELPHNILEIALPTISVDDVDYPLRL